MDTKEKILVAAARLFQEHGFAATGLNEIITVSGAPKGSLYHYFPKGKIQLASEAVRFAGKIIEENMARSLARYDEPVKAFIAVLRDIRGHFSDGVDLMDVSFSIISLEAADAGEELRRPCEEALDRREALLSKKLEEAGWLPDEARQIATFFQTMIEGAIVISRTRGDPSVFSLLESQIQFLLARKRQDDTECNYE